MKKINGKVDKLNWQQIQIDISSLFQKDFIRIVQKTYL